MVYCLWLFVLYLVVFIFGLWFDLVLFDLDSLVLDFVSCLIVVVWVLFELFVCYFALVWVWLLVFACFSCFNCLCLLV